MKLQEVAQIIYKAGYLWVEAKSMINRLIVQDKMPTTRHSALRILRNIHELLVEIGVDYDEIVLILISILGANVLIKSDNHCPLLYERFALSLSDVGI